MDAKLLTAAPGILEEYVGADIPHLTDDIEFAQAIEAGPRVCNPVKLVVMLMGDLADGMQPVVHEAAPAPVHRCAHAAAAGSVPQQ